MMEIKEASIKKKDPFPSAPRMTRTSCMGVVCEADHEVDLQEALARYEWGDLWSDADVVSAIIYVRGAKKLRMPPCWRKSFPTFVPEDIPGDSDSNQQSR